jgi:Ran GTPase-activating protein (RanGAP) involved in mRNA processing and transport
MILSANPVLDLTQFPPSVFAAGGLIHPVLRTITLTQHALGICCSDCHCPNLFRLLTPLIQEDDGIQFIHVPDCGIDSGMAELKEKVMELGSISVGYWNLNGNKISDFRDFARIIELTFAPVYFMGLSRTGLSSRKLADLFVAMSTNTCLWELRGLELAGLPISAGAFTEFENFLAILNRKKLNRISSVDISEIQGPLKDVVYLVVSEIPLLETLNLSHNQIEGDVLGVLTDWLRETRTLRVLDLSGTSLQPDEIADVILAIGKNVEMTDVTLKLNDLNLHGVNLLPLFRALLTGDAFCDKKWRSLSLDRNALTPNDLRNLIPLFAQFPNLHELSLAGNFTSAKNNPPLWEVLIELVSIEALERLSLAGDANHKIGPELGRVFLHLKSKCFLKELDISNNNIGDNAFRLLNELLAQHLEKVSLDGSGVKAIEVLMDLVSIVHNNQKLIFVKFPRTDVESIARDAKDKDGGLLR